MALSIAELKVELGKRSLPTKGKKDELIIRLLADKGLAEINVLDKQKRPSMVTHSSRKCIVIDHQDINVTEELQPTHVPLYNRIDKGSDFRSDFQDFNKLVFDKIIVLKRTYILMQNQENHPIDYERFFIRSLEDRIPFW